MPNQMSGPNPPRRAGMLDPSDPLDIDTMMTTGQATLTGRMTANARIDEYVLAGHADVSTYMHEQFRNLVMQLNAFMAEGAPETMTVRATATATATATVEGPAIESVWAAVCVWWLAPALRWLAGLLEPRAYGPTPTMRERLVDRLDDAARWCDDHAGDVVAERTVTEEHTETESRKVYRRVCPHIGVPMDRKGGYDLHVQWLNQSPHPLDDPDAPPLSANELMQRMYDTLGDRRIDVTQGWGLTEYEYATLAEAGHVPLWPERPEDARVGGLPIYAPNVTTIRPVGMEGRTEASSYSLLRGVIDGHGDVWLDALAPSQTAAREALAEAIRTVRGEA